MRRLLAFALLLVLAVPGSTLAVIPEGGVNLNPIPEAPVAPPSLNAVLELLKKGDAAAALKGAREFVRNQPGSAVGHEVHGLAAQANRLWREAKKAEGWFRKAVAASPDMGVARRGLALSLLAQRQLRAALAEVQEALKRDGGDVDAKYLLAQIMNDAGRPAAAEPVLDEVLTGRPDHLPALLLQGTVKLELRKTDEAEALFARVVQRDPKSSQARMGLAIIERSRGQLVPAAAAMEGVIKDRPDWALAYFELGRTRLGLHQLDAALKAFDRAEQTSTDPAVTRVRAAHSLAVRCASVRGPA